MRKELFVKCVEYIKNKIKSEDELQSIIEQNLRRNPPPQ